MFPLAFSLSLIGLVIASYTDLKSRIIPDWVPYSLGISGILLAGYSSYLSGSFLPLFWSVSLLLLTYGGAYVFWRMGAWAGGDVKLFTGLPALNPFNLHALGSLLGLSFFAGGKEWIVVSSLPVFMLNLFLFSVVMLIPYTALLSLKALARPSNRREFLSLSLKSVQDALKYSLLIVFFSAVLEGLGLPLFLLLIPLLLVSFFPSWVGYGGVLAGIVVLFLAPAGLSGFFPLLVVMILVTILRSWYGFAQKHVLTKVKRISALEDGDIVGERIVMVDGSIVREPPVSFHTIIKAGFQRDIRMIFRFLHPVGEVLADPRRAAGVYPDDIARLQAEVKAGRLSDEIRVKASSPFAPAVLLSYVFLNLVGDLFLGWVGGA
ncbi:MAG: A24 family peptidase [archaeon]